MSNGAPQSEYAGIAAQFAAARAERDADEARGLKDTSTSKEREIQWSARQALVLAWLGIIM
jgi:hypothetical protein